MKMEEEKKETVENESVRNIYLCRRCGGAQREKVDVCPYCGAKNPWDPTYKEEEHPEDNMPAQVIERKHQSFFPMAIAGAPFSIFIPIFAIAAEVYSICMVAKSDKYTAKEKRENYIFCSVMIFCSAFLWIYTLFTSTTDPGTSSSTSTAILKFLFPIFFLF